MNNELYIKIKEHLGKLTQNTMWEGHVFTVGGCVRDEIMGEEVKDIDVCITLPNGGIRFADWLWNNGHAKKPATVYPQYGTAMLQLKSFPEVDLEFAQTRKEQYADHTCRNPETTFGNIEEDSYRRDLTINSLYCDLSSGEIVDITGRGVEDIRNHVVRTPKEPDLVYDEDPLRILRCIRFASRYGWEIEPATYNGMIRKVNRLEILKKERIREELDKMLTHKHPVMAMELLRKTGAMHFVIPQLEETYEMMQNDYHFGTVWEHTMMALEKLKSDSLELRMAALLHDIGKTRVRSVSEGKVHFLKHELASADMVEEILRPLKYSNDFIHNVAFLVGNHMRCKKWGNECENMKAKSLRKLQFECVTEARFRDLMLLIDADNKAHDANHCMSRQVEIILQYSEKMKEEGSTMFGYKLPIEGKEIMQIKGIKQGPKVRECIDYLLKLAFVNPQRDKTEVIKLLKGYKISK